jgi:hypothetical protein
MRAGLLRTMTNDLDAHLHASFISPRAVASIARGHSERSEEPPKKRVSHTCHEGQLVAVEGVVQDCEVLRCAQDDHAMRGIQISNFFGNRERILQPAFVTTTTSS